MKLAKKIFGYDEPHSVFPYTMFVLGVILMPVLWNNVISSNCVNGLHILKRNLMVAFVRLSPFPPHVENIKIESLCNKCNNDKSVIWKYYKNNSYWFILSVGFCIRLLFLVDG